MSNKAMKELVKVAKGIVDDDSAMCVEKNTSVEKAARLQDRLVEALKIREVKAIELSEELQINRGTVSYYMSGKSTPKADRLRLISEFLNVSEMWLLGYNVPMERHITAEPLNDIEQKVERDSKTFDFCISKAIDILLELKIDEEIIKQQILKHYDIRYSEVTAILKSKKKSQTIEWTRY